MVVGSPAPLEHPSAGLPPSQAPHLLPLLAQAPLECLLSSSLARLLLPSSSSSLRLLLLSSSSSRAPQQQQQAPLEQALQAPSEGLQRSCSRQRSSRLQLAQGRQLQAPLSLRPEQEASPALSRQGLL
jgi:hypothetical protein